MKHIALFSFPDGRRRDAPHRKPPLKKRAKLKLEKFKSPSLIGRLLPNLATLTALCTGLTAIHFGLSNKWELAVASVLIAGLLDGIDGPLARFFGSASDFGAELDSLADFVNFGVTPSLLIYLFSLHRWEGRGWAFCLFFSACTALRLARFNVQRNSPPYPSFLSVGSPAPAGALIALLPLVSSFTCCSALASPYGFAVSLLGSALLMISRFPTFVLKGFSIPDYASRLLWILLVVLLIALLTAPWETVLLLGVGYLISLPVSFALFRNASPLYGKRARRMRYENANGNASSVGDGDGDGDGDRDGDRDESESKNDYENEDKISSTKAISRIGS